MSLDLGLTAIEQVRDTDVFICSYPRSGVTWFQNLIAGLVYGVDPRYAHDALIQDLVPDIHQTKFFKRYGERAFFKTHFLPQTHYRRVINLVRDGRDAVVSFHHFLRALRVDVDLAGVIEGKGWIHRWHEHVEAYLDNPYGAETMLVRYEDLRADTATELERIADFIGVRREASYFHYIAQRASFANAQEKEREMGWSSKVWPSDQPFVRRGIVGSYRDEMPAHLLHRFMEYSDVSLHRLGYE